MPELPEVETVRLGLADHVLGRTIRDVAVLRDRAVRRQVGGSGAFSAAVVGRRIDAVVRRGKFLWFVLDGSHAILAHLGMSGQFLVKEADADADSAPHCRVRFALDDAQLWFSDQRTFGYLNASELVPTGDGGPGGRGDERPLIPAEAAHIARDLLDPTLDRDVVADRIASGPVGIKRRLLDQAIVSGVGNIYADEGLWRAGVHYAAPGSQLGPGRVRAVLDACADVMAEAVLAGGTSFDALYVRVNGQSGYFDRSLAAYGRAGQDCTRCDAVIVREPFMNRSSYRCPGCQPLNPAG